MAFDHGGYQLTFLSQGVKKDDINFMLVLLHFKILEFAQELVESGVRLIDGFFGGHLKVSELREKIRNLALLLPVISFIDLLKFIPDFFSCRVVLYDNQDRIWNTDSDLAKSLNVILSPLLLII